MEILAYYQLTLKGVLQGFWVKKKLWKDEISNLFSFKAETCDSNIWLFHSSFVILCHSLIYHHRTYSYFNNWSIKLFIQKKVNSELALCPIGEPNLGPPILLFLTPDRFTLYLKRKCQFTVFSLLFHVLLLCYQFNAYIFLCFLLFLNFF